MSEPMLDYVAAGGPRLAEFLDALLVDRYWLKGHHIVWQTGQQNAPIGVGRSRYTHCSTFVAAAAMRLGIYILQPPFHNEYLLASAQDHWLRGYLRYQGKTAADAGWVRLGRGVESAAINLAQNVANKGKFVLASFAQRPIVDDVTGEPMAVPGHIAIVRPQEPPVNVVAMDSPTLAVCAAGHVNSAAISIETSFAEHPGAWPNNIDFYAHDTPLETDFTV